ncbi:hypothetical protein RM739_03075 [Staphylococcus epidermidis]|jgi:hypothetical protein|nr:hypothetical protein [Staphylococcus epidermidis]EJE00208.1 hypothetical protein HMPREF9986_05301 [Staphylococcus epidermidis NIHLM040]MCG7825436.1 hypothetical protein [Staphylococcus epidermidis]MCO6336592.1 hypothetical protein [Staphylococcus epidermidis]MDS3952615.1 hypothetical protein [Staphylococcus epidermidis]MDT0652621.1 hypothetical protein [Staphylococcus epidermidis]
MNSLHDKDNTYKRLAKEAYGIESNQKEITIKYSNKEKVDFKVVGFRQNKFNGLKMAGVSPIEKDGEVNKNELYI